jgi:hypothetical protein
VADFSRLLEVRSYSRAGRHLILFNDPPVVLWGSEGQTRKNEL